ncbi:LamG-like jellyroll fold domain-containing protein [Flavobacterium limi]|uniref:LamG-like jellyroll fold domain-containing protein n=1 Tax=Flavobacterium limi TaxID=2045105 RepID=A0ABQ1U4K5_9FLAO|nr:LamG-like jellyroll fold domain-containing protein [Flavobacterium limi]GGF09478.1 hypothetical protein GCM10011518_18320 [Flavobacterium limi]
MKLKLYSLFFITCLSFAQQATHLNFDGFNDQINLGNALSTTLDPLNKITVEAWVKPTNNTAQNGVIFGNYAYPTDNGLCQVLLRRDQNTYTFHVNDGISLKVVTAAASVQFGTWQHVAGVWDGSLLKIYVNGVLAATTTGVTGSSFLSLPNNSYTIGFSYAGAPDEAFIGDIDEVRLWNYDRTAAQILEKKDCELLGTETGLLAYYNFNQENAGGDNSAATTLTNLVSGGSNGTLSNFTLNGSTSNWVSGSPIVTGNICTTLSSPSLEFEKNIKIYPNPAKDKVNINIQNATNVELRVYNLNGNTVLSEKLNTATNSVSIENLTTGTYFFKVISNEGTSTTKVIKL